ncbi:hypothetical protein C6P40_004765 [Pichia californica]|uniref:WD40 repeat-like protein n=1 Tax=Pichia californica TaxID=460514 RepID=A0A9P6WME7_9ASCO|nr:hypothetical protein C6P42_005138 [[Candida] californica]KAG0689606.1 hypothetical protein C6P40_004765 [[Candida] californica]
MLPSFPYPSLNSFQKRSSIASERPFSYKNEFNIIFNKNQQSSNTNINNINNPNTHPNDINYDIISPTSTSFDQSMNQNINSNNNYNYNNYSTLPSSYTSHYPLYALDWSVSRNQHFAKIALGSYREDSSNKLEILYGTKNNDNNPEVFNFNKVYDHSIKYPITRLQWDPSMSLLNTDIERFATTSECLRIYEIGSVDNNNNNTNDKILYEKAALTNSKSKNLNQLPPMTSFDWNRFNPLHLITCSIDTTCTVWDLIKETFIAKTQLIAHDSEVFDVKYIYGDINVFTSCSSDGSVRLFDLRNLEQSTIIYEKSDNNNNSNTSNSLVRIATSNYNANQIAVLNSNSNQILILDLRNVGIPLYNLNNNSANINSISWHPNKNILLSGSDDCQIMTYDFTNQDTLQNSNDQSQLQSQSQSPNLNRLPDYAYSANMEVNNVCWDPDGKWIGLNNGKQFQALQFE